MNIWGPRAPKNAKIQKNVYFYIEYQKNREKSKNQNKKKKDPKKIENAQKVNFSGHCQGGNLKIF